MPLKYPDSIEHNNPNLPLIRVESNTIEGLAHVASIAERDALPTEKRCEGAIVVVAGQPFVFADSNLSNWTQSSSWSDMTAAPDSGIQYSDLNATTALPSGTGTLNYNDTNGTFTLTPPDVSGIATNASDISAIEAEQITQNTDIAQNASDIAAALGSIAGNAADINDLEVSQGVQDGKISTLETEMDAVEAEQVTQNTNISNNTSAIAGKADQTALNALQSEVDGKVGDILAGDNIDSVTNAGDVYTINAADAPVQTITSGSGNVTVTEPTTGDFEISVAAAAEPELTSPITVTDPIGSIEVNDVIAAGTPLEDIIRDMLVSYQAPTINITSPNPGIIEHNVALSIPNVTFTRTNGGNINTGVQGQLQYVDAEGGTNSESLLYTPNGTNSQTVSGLNVSDVPLVEGVGTAGTSGTPKSRESGYLLQVTEENTEGNPVVRVENYRVRFRTYFGATNVIWSSSTQTASVIQSLLSNRLSADSRETWTTSPANDSLDNYTYLVMPQCHYTDGGGISVISQNGTLDVTGAFSVVGQDDYQGCEYVFLKTAGTKAFADNLSIIVS